ncbi:MAG: helix-hairpin-helix domain-containing protein [bacterium]|nr:helix-hairpin-helix domain-containing protein [bacterium]
MGVMKIFEKIKNYIRLSKNDQQIATILVIIATTLLISYSLKPQEKFSAEEFKININKVSKEELEELPGVGPVIAQRIVIFREREGHFNSLQDILKIKGIGKKKLQKIIPHISPLE